VADLASLTIGAVPQVGHAWGAIELAEGIDAAAPGADALFAMTDGVADCSFADCSMKTYLLLRIGLYRLSSYLEKRIHWLKAAARLSHPLQGLIPMAYVTRLMASPKPISSSIRNPGRRTRWSGRSGPLLPFFVLAFCFIGVSPPMAES
jgi:hypothetical protein